MSLRGTVFSNPVFSVVFENMTFCNKVKYIISTSFRLQKEQLKFLPGIKGLQFKSITPYMGIINPSQVNCNIDGTGIKALAKVKQGLSTFDNSSHAKAMK